MAHEINNPLTGVLTFAHLLREGGSMGERESQDLEVIIRETTRVREIVRGLLDFSRQRPANKSLFDLDEMVRHTLRLVGSQKEFGGIAMAHRPGATPVEAYGDRGQLQQVLLNLCFNACESMPDGGELTVSTSEGEGA